MQLAKPVRAFYCRICDPGLAVACVDDLPCPDVPSINPCGKFC